MQITDLLLATYLRNRGLRFSEIWRTEEGRSRLMNT